MNILSQFRNPAALMALVIVAPLMFMIGGNYRLPSSGDTTQLLYKNIALELTGSGVNDELLSVRTNLANARQAMANRDYPLASRLTEQAEDRRPGRRTQAQSTRTRKAAQDSQYDARRLRAEIALKALTNIASN